MDTTKNLESFSGSFLFFGPLNSTVLVCIRMGQRKASVLMTYEQPTTIHPPPSRFIANFQCR